MSLSVMAPLQKVPPRKTITQPSTDSNSPSPHHQSTTNVISISDSSDTERDLNVQRHTSHTETTGFVSYKPTLPKAEALEILRKLLNGNDFRYELKYFKDLRNKKLSSKVYDQYVALCHANTTEYAGWALCRYVQTGSCTVANGCQRFNPEQGTTNMLRHINSHARADGQQHHPRNLGPKGKKEICKAAVSVVVKDLHPYSFAEGEGMREFIAAVFKAGQSMPVGERIITDDIAPCARAVHDGTSVVAKVKRDLFKQSIQSIVGLGGGVSIDGVTLKTQEKHFYDLILHFFSFSSTNVFEATRPTLQNRTIILAEAEGGNTASDIRLLMNSNLISNTILILIFLLQYFTLVTDWAAVMPNIVGASISSNISPINEKWMGCIVHQLNTAIETSLKLCETDPFLDRVNHDLAHVKNLIRIFKQSKWNGELGLGFHLTQEIETRLGTTFSVADRFVKSGSAAFAIVENKSSEPARKAKNSILKGTDPGGRYVPFPAIEAVVDAFDIVVDAQKRLEASKSPTTHLFLPLLRRVYDELDRISVGGEVDRGFSRGKIRPSDYSQQLCGMVRNALKNKIVVHDLWIAACMLHPFLQL